MYKREIKTNRRKELVDITSHLEQVIKESGVRSGRVLVFSPHTTTAITINENADPDVSHDIIHGLRKIVGNPGFRHAEGNSDAHLKSSIVGCSEQLMIEHSSAVLGRWQGLFFCEFDGPRTRHIYFQIETF